MFETYVYFGNQNDYGSDDAECASRYYGLLRIRDYLLANNNGTRVIDRIVNQRSFYNSSNFLDIFLSRKQFTCPFYLMNICNYSYRDNDAGVITVTCFLNTPFVDIYGREFSPTIILHDRYDGIFRYWDMAVSLCMFHFASKLREFCLKSPPVVEDCCLYHC